MIGPTPGSSASRRQVSFLRQRVTIIASSFWIRRSRSSSWSMSSPKIARARSDRSAPAMAVGACTMKRLQVLLVRRLHRYEAHRRTRRCFKNRLRVDRIVLRAFDERLHKTRIDEAHLAAGGEPASSPIMRAGAGLHRDCCRSQVADHFGQLRPADLPRQNYTVGIDAVNVERPLAEIDRQ